MTPIFALETAFTKCVAECSVGGPGNEWKIAVCGVLAIVSLILAGGILNTNANAGLSHGRGRGGFGLATLLLIFAIVVGGAAFLIPTFVAVEVLDVDQTRCSWECAHLAPNGR